MIGLFNKIRWRIQNVHFTELGIGSLIFKILALVLSVNNFVYQSFGEFIISQFVFVSSLMASSFSFEQLAMKKCKNKTNKYYLRCLPLTWIVFIFLMIRVLGYFITKDRMLNLANEPWYTWILVIIEAVYIYIQSCYQKKVKDNI